jgi:hypothetical protein
MEMDNYEIKLAQAQQLVDFVSNGGWLGKSRLVQNGRVMVGLHGVKRAKAKARARGKKPIAFRLGEGR